jgi:hypothetical protein
MVRTVPVQGERPSLPGPTVGDQFRCAACWNLVTRSALPNSMDPGDTRVGRRYSTQFLRPANQVKNGVASSVASTRSSRSRAAASAFSKAEMYWSSSARCSGSASSGTLPARAPTRRADDCRRARAAGRRLGSRSAAGRRGGRRAGLHWGRAGRFPRGHRRHLLDPRLAEQRDLPAVRQHRLAGHRQVDPRREQLRRCRTRQTLVARAANSRARTSVVHSAGDAPLPTTATSAGGDLRHFRARVGGAWSGRRDPRSGRNQPQAGGSTTAPRASGPVRPALCQAGAGASGSDPPLLER